MASEEEQFEMEEISEFDYLDNNELHSCTEEEYPDQLFLDGRRKIDFVLTYFKCDSTGWTKTNAKMQKLENTRKGFEENLKLQGLELEIESVQKSKGKLFCVKLHGPWDFLSRQAELIQIRMPISKDDIEEENPVKDFFSEIWKKCTKKFRLDDKYKVEKSDYFSAPFVAERANEFKKLHDKYFFNSTQRSRMVYDCLIRTGYDKNRPDRIGIEHLLSNGAYDGAYPLHETLHKRHVLPKRLRSNAKKFHVESVKTTDRQLLYDIWANPRCFYKYQPLDLIRKYFGEKVSVYFAWLGYYTAVLIPASIIGILSVGFGAWSIHSMELDNQVCDPKLAGNYTMCPRCDNLFNCGFWKLKSSCLYATLTHVFDNSFTVLFAMFMSIWATLFLEGWTRYRHQLTWKWDLQDYGTAIDEEEIRPEYQMQVRGTRINPITNIEEPHLSFKQKLLRLCASGVTVLFFLCLVLAFVGGIIIYRCICSQMLYFEPIREYAKWITLVTSSTINLICIILLGKVYQKLAWKLTTWELPRTETEFENSYALKVFLFQFINYYSTLFYIAFLKGRFSSFPGFFSKKNFYLFGEYRLEHCDPAGCMVELVVQLAIIMVGKQFFNNFVEIFMPLVQKWWRKRDKAAKLSGKKETLSDDDDDLKDDEEDQCLYPEEGLKSNRPRWLRDYNLNAVPEDYMFNEYLEMVIQFGFVTLFVAAFPLAPLFALLNNIMEVRLDAYKFLVAYRRPQPARTKNLGIWIDILDSISKLAVIANACVIAFTSDFIPRLLFRIMHDGNMDGYVEWSLSYYDVEEHYFKDFFGWNIIIFDGNEERVEHCRYRDFRRLPCSLRPELNETTSFVNCDEEDSYSYSVIWWYVLAARLGFVLVFEHLVFLIKNIVAYLIPDMPSNVMLKMQRETYLSRNARREYELQKLASVRKKEVYNI